MILRTPCPFKGRRELGAIVFSVLLIEGLLELIFYGEHALAYPQPQISDMSGLPNDIDPGRFIRLPRVPSGWAIGSLRLFHP